MQVLKPQCAGRVGMRMGEGLTCSQEQLLVGAGREWARRQLLGTPREEEGGERG